MAVARAPSRAETFELIEGDGVVLRRPQMSDFEEWARLRERSRAFLTPWEPTWAVDEFTRAAYRRRLRRYAKDLRDGIALPFLVFRDTDGALVGGCNLNNIRRGVLQAGALGYWVGEPFQRSGYTRAAVRAAVGFAFGAMELHRVEAACIPSNTASRRLLEQLGFSQEGVARSYLRINGVWRDHVLYALVKGDPVL